MRRKIQLQIANEKEFEMLEEWRKKESKKNRLFSKRLLKPFYFLILEKGRRIGFIFIEKKKNELFIRKIVLNEGFDEEEYRDPVLLNLYEYSFENKIDLNFPSSRLKEPWFYHVADFIIFGLLNG